MMKAMRDGNTAQNLIIKGFPIWGWMPLGLNLVTGYSRMMNQLSIEHSILSQIMHLKPQRTLRGNIAKRKTYLKSSFFLYVFKFGRGSFAKSFSLKCAQRFFMGKDVIYWLRRIFSVCSVVNCKIWVYIPNGNVENFGFRIVYKGSCRFY